MERPKNYNGLAFCLHLIQKIWHEFCNNYDLERFDSKKDTFRIGLLLDCSASNVNRLFMGPALFLEQNLVIILSDLRLGCLCQTKTIWSIPDPVWCEQLHSEYDSISPSIVHIVSD